jgi:3-deoxy-D-manno-octulosonic acid (KDO) 8-phosphate synthase
MDDDVMEQFGWKSVLLTYECPHCAAAPGERCVTSTGRASNVPHVKRAAAAVRCQSCGDRLPSTHDGTLCGYCRMVSKLTEERYR